ncbi:hypothetical protein HDZ31DRAFT_69361 [Schizophyllum fasciatum]
MDTRYLLLHVATGAGIDTYTFRMKEASSVQQLADAAKNPEAYLERRKGSLRDSWLAANRQQVVAVDDAAEAV